MELLAPAGGFSQLDAAIRFGADAVYLATKRFGMRARAENFELEDMPAVVQRAHEAGVKVHVTLNILMNQRDIAALPEYCSALDEAGVDALIIGDMGAFAIAKQYAPHVDLHVSTQASVLNAQAARMWYELGAKRIVLAREARLEDIRAMREELPDDLEIEAFAHGAMCVAYSGRCLLSATMTGRSANRGACAQSCRWNYALVEEKRPGEYFPIEEDTNGSLIFNAQDMCMINHLQELKEAGVDSIKIEGRNKKAFYVATVVGAYRLALDGGDVAHARRELDTISHRPYCTGFYYGEAPQAQDVDGYVKECIHVATVEESREIEPGKYVTTVICFNRFAENEELEYVSPHRPSGQFVPHGLQWLAPADGGKPFVERGRFTLAEVRTMSKLFPVEVANRSRERYSFVTDVVLKPGDYIRSRIEQDI